MSHRMLGMEMHSCARKMSMQKPSTHGSQILLRGLHWNEAAKMQATFQAVEMPPQYMPHLRMLGSGKMRKYKKSSEILYMLTAVV